MSSQQTTDSPQAKVLQSFVEGFRRRDVDLIASQLHNDHRHVFYPRSLGMSVHTREDYIRKAAMFMGKWADGSEPNLRLIMETPGTVVFHFTNKAKTLVGVDMSRESILIAQIAPDEDGSLKIKQLEEFTDSKLYLDFIKAVAEATENSAA